MIRLAIILLTGAGGPALVVVGVLGLRQAAQFAWRARAVPGMVVGYVETARRAMGGDVCQAKVRYALPDGRYVDFVNPNFTHRVTYRVGQPVTVLYDPDSPGQALVRSAWQWLNPAITLLVGTALSAVCAVNLAHL